MHDETKPVLVDNAIHIGEHRELRPAINDQWQARRELAEQMRKLTAAMLTTDVPAPELRALAARLQDDIARFEKGKRIYGRAAHRDQLFGVYGKRPDMLYEMSPTMGISNPVAFPMHTWREHGRIHADVTPDWVFEGPLGHLHGGVIASLFDQVLGLAQHLAGGGGVTGSLNVRYRRPVPLNKTLHLIAELNRVEGRKRFMSGELWVGDELAATSEGIFFTEKSAPPESVSASTVATKITT